MHCVLGTQSCWYRLLCHTMHNQVEENKDASSTNSICLDQDEPSIQILREQWLFHRGKGPSEGPAQASKRLCVPGEKQKQRNSEV